MKSEDLHVSDRNVLYTAFIDSFKWSPMTMTVLSDTNERIYCNHLLQYRKLILGQSLWFIMSNKQLCSTLLYPATHHDLFKISINLSGSFLFFSSFFFLMESLQTQGQESSAAIFFVSHIVRCIFMTMWQQRNPRKCQLSPWSCIPALCLLLIDTITSLFLQIAGRT